MSWPAQTPDLNPTENLLLVSDCYLSNVKVKTSIPRCMKTDWKSLNSSEVSSYGVVLRWIYACFLDL